MKLRARSDRTGNPATAGEGETPNAIEARGVTAGYGAVPVVYDIDIHVAPGEVVALLGPNGAGKTTLLLALSGELPVMRGEVRLGGVPTKMPLYRRARAGMGFVTEERSIFKGLTTTNNLRAGSCDPQKALELFPELSSRLDVPAGLLSGGEQQMLTLARAIAREPSVLLADELSLGLAPLIVNRLFDQIKDAAATLGTGILLVEQHVRKALAFVDRAYVINRGRVVLTGTGAELRSNISEIENSYLTSRIEE